MYTIMVVSLLLPASCNGQNKSGSTEAKEPKVDIHTAIITDNMVVLKHHIAFGKDLNKREPMIG